MTRDRAETGFLKKYFLLYFLSLLVIYWVFPSPALKLVKFGHMAEMNCSKEEEGSDRKDVFVKQEGTQNHLEQPGRRARLGTE